jgi:mono/diheme cytochrome c family protein
VSHQPRTDLHEDPELLRSLFRWQAAGVVVFVLLIAAFPVYKAVEGPRRHDALVSQQAALVRSGKQLWGLNCASCHGERGQGVTAPALNSKQFLTAISDDQMHRIVAAGITGTAMPSWWDEFGGPLTDQQIAAIVAYVRSWEKTAPSRPDWRNPQGSSASSAGG